MRRCFELKNIVKWDSYYKTCLKENVLSRDIVSPLIVLELLSFKDSLNRMFLFNEKHIIGIAIPN